MFLIVLILKISLFLFVMSFLVMGIYAIYHGVVVSRISDASLSWPETKGIITDSYIHVYEKSDDDGLSSTWYETRIRYSYTVNGEGYYGNSITLLSPGLIQRQGGGGDIYYRLSKGPAVKVYMTWKSQTAILVKEKVGRINVFTAIGVFDYYMGLRIIGLVAALRD